jgi:hypothetical protein
MALTGKIPHHSFSHFMSLSQKETDENIEKSIPLNSGLGDRFPEYIRGNFSPVRTQSFAPYVPVLEQLLNSGSSFQMNWPDSFINQMVSDLNSQPDQLNWAPLFHHYGKSRFTIFPI